MPLTGRLLHSECSFKTLIHISLGHIITKIVSTSEGVTGSEAILYQENKSIPALLSPHDNTLILSCFISSDAMDVPWMPYDPLNVKLICSKVFMGLLYFKEEKHRLVQLTADNRKTFERNQERFGLSREKNKLPEIRDQNSMHHFATVLSVMTK